MSVPSSAPEPARHDTTVADTAAAVPRTTDQPSPARRRSLTGWIGAHPRWTLVAIAVFLVVAGAFGGPVASKLSTDGGFVPSAADSVVAADQIENATGRESTAGIVVLVQTPGGLAANAATVGQVATTLQHQAGIAGIAAPRPDDPPNSPARGLIARNGQSVLVTATLTKDADDATVVKHVLKTFDGHHGVKIGGPAVSSVQVGRQVESDLGRAELLAFPILLLLALLIFRGRATLLPVIVGAATVLGTFLTMAIVNHFYGLSIFALNLVMGLGLGLAVDYSLFLLTRYREELQRQGPAGAIAATMRTAGRTVAFSAATVAAALITLTVYPMNFLRSMGIAGSVVALAGAASALLIAPAVFALWGPKLARRTAGEPTDGHHTHGRWYRVSHAVMRRPGVIAVATGAVMLALAAPMLNTTWTPVDGSVVPTDQSSRQVSDAVTADFGGTGNAPTTVVIRTSAADDTAAVRGYTATIDQLPTVTKPGTPRQLDPRTWQLDLPSPGDPADDNAQTLVNDIRSVRTSPGLQAKVTGPAAQFVDQQKAIGDRLPLGLALLVGLTMLVLWALTGSVLLPLTAVVMNALTVGAALGILNLIYPHGHFASLLNYTPNGGIEPTNFLVTAAVVFALSTDYGVFLLGRIKEVRDHGEHDREAIAVGLQHTGRVVTAAAILLAVAVGAFGTSSISFIQQIGVATAFAVLVDAFIVRSLLVPALMGLLNRGNWWAPRPLRLLHDRLGLARMHG